MKRPPYLIELTRGGMVESLHAGHAVICDSSGKVLEGWGDPQAVIYPRSSCKMMQALPLVESGAADAAGLGSPQLALACASHEGAALHADAVRAWLAAQGQGEDDLLCGTEMPRDRTLREALIRAHEGPCQVHNNCSGKHAGFLTLTRHLKADPDYVALDHPVQKAVRTAFEEVTGQESPGYGIDGCSAPNFATTLSGLATGMARFAAAGRGSDARDAAMARLTQAMIAHPELVAGDGRACTELMTAAGGAAAVKTGAEAVFVAILPGRGLGVALKIVDGGTRAAEAGIAAILVHLGVLEANDPAVLKRVDAPIVNRAGHTVGQVRRAPGFP